MEKNEKVGNGQASEQKKQASVCGRTKYGVSKDEINVKTALQEVKENISDIEKKFTRSQNSTREHVKGSNVGDKDV